ncbi:MAG: DUF3298 and DUF4163 domain-containing protein [Bacteroidia bacterium]|nr:DUF3298 and DUF4163 domain-containing protein [Bacteroidia bacterium]
MKLKHNIVLAFILLVFFASCNQKPVNIKFSNFSISSAKYPIASDSTRSCIFSADIPIIEAGNSILVDSINAFISKTFFGKFSKTNLSLKEKLQAESDSFYQIYLNDFSEFNQSDFPLTYEYDLKLTIPFYNQKYVTIKNENYDYMGGAHGYYSTLYYVFNVENGKLLSSVNELVNDTLKLQEIAKQQFYKLKNIDVNKPINDQGYWFEKKAFSLNNNFGLLKDTLVFTYNPYEITNYAAGQTEIKIPMNMFK